MALPDIEAIRALYQTNAWRRVRRRHIEAHPLCQVCLEDEVVEVATVVNHRTRHDGNTAIFFNPDELVSLCRPHQDAARAAKGLDGRVSTIGGVSISDVVVEVRPSGSCPYQA